MSAARVPGISRLLPYFIFGIITVAAFTFYALGNEMKRGHASVPEVRPPATKFRGGPAQSGEELELDNMITAPQVNHIETKLNDEEPPSPLHVQIPEVPVEDAPPFNILYTCVSSHLTFKERAVLVWETWGSKLRASHKLIFAVNKEVRQGRSSSVARVFFHASTSVEKRPVLTPVLNTPAQFQWEDDQSLHSTSIPRNNMFVDIWRGGDKWRGKGWVIAQSRFLASIVNQPIEPRSWLMLFDDDAFINVAEVEKLISFVDPDHPAIYGQMTCAKACGGAGILISPSLLQSLRQRKGAVEAIPPKMAYDKHLSQVVLGSKLGELKHDDRFSSQPPTR